MRDFTHTPQATQPAETLAGYSKKHEKFDKLKRSAADLAAFIHRHDHQSEFEKAVIALRTTGEVMDTELSLNTSTGETSFRVTSCWLSRHRLDPLSQAAKSTKWRAKFFKIMPKLVEEFPDHEFAFLTLTDKNCPIDELNSKCKKLNSSFLKMMRTKPLAQYFYARGKAPIAGYFKTLEVTKGDVEGYAHPHLHVLLHLPKSYFENSNRINQRQKNDTDAKGFVELWRDALGVDYDPFVFISKVKRKQRDGFTEYLSDDPHGTQTIDAVLEVTKYQTKSEDLTHNPDWTFEYIRQMKGVVNISTNGTIKKALAAIDAKPVEEICVEENENPIIESDLPVEIQNVIVENIRFRFCHDPKIRRYIRINLRE